MRRITGVALGPAVAVALVGLFLLAGAASARVHARAAPVPPYVAVSGNHLVDSSSAPERLLGVNRSGSEYMCMGGSEIFDGPVSSESVQAMAAWHINAVRVPLNEDCWLGINGVPAAVGGGAYQGAIEQYVQTLQSFGLIVILDLHWAAPGAYRAESQWPMADADHSPSFWASVATAFASNHGVVFDLFNEPYVGSWACWLEGCQETYNDAGTVVSFKTAGMQSLVNAVRGTGATQPLMLGGLEYANDESQWLKYEPLDAAHQLVVSFHNYNEPICDTEACWNSTIAPLTEHVPVVTGEMGENRCRSTYIKQYMPWADARGVSYLGWAWDSTRAPSRWNCSRGPALIKTYKGAPTRFGAGLKEHLALIAPARRARRRAA
jgi:hypothetical protein